MRKIQYAPLYELDEPGKYFEVDRVDNLVEIWCVPNLKAKHHNYKPFRALIPLNSPTRLNDIFTKLRLGQRAF